MSKWLCVLLTISAPLLAADEAVVPLERAHSHNDYEHARPLLDALDHGFCSIEADIYLVDGKLLVGHFLEDVQPERTLEALYLDPLLKRVRENGGRVFPNGPGVTLLVDIKNDARNNLLTLLKILEPYREMLTEFTSDATRPGAVTVIISGIYPYMALTSKSPRLAAADGRPPMLGASCQNFAMVSQAWDQLFKWDGNGAMPEDEAARLREMVEKAHAAGQRIRFWALPQGPNVLPVLYDAGVDLLNADDLAAMQAFLLERQKAPAAAAK